MTFFISKAGTFAACGSGQRRTQTTASYYSFFFRSPRAPKYLRRNSLGRKSAWLVFPCPPRARPTDRSLLSCLNFRLVLRGSPPAGSRASLNEEDDAHALAPSRVLLGIALGLARAGLVGDAAKELVKAAAVRPR